MTGFIRFLRIALALLLSVTSSGARVEAAVIGPLGMSCNQVHSPDGVDYTFCTGKVPSFDGTPLDADLTLPSTLSQMHLPLLVMLGGDDNHKTEWESPTLRNSAYAAADGYNNVAFVQRGYAVLTYSNRGAFGSCSPYGDPSANPPEGPDPTVLDPTGPCRNARVGMPDRRFEVHDLKYLIGLLVDAGVADQARIGLTGFSAGAATVLLAGLEGGLVTLPDGTTAAWTSPHGVPLNIAAAVPYAGYTDVINLMAPNGRAADGVFAPDGDRLRPVGVPEMILDADEPALIATNAMMVAPANPAAGTDAFFRTASAYLAGEPFAENPALTDAGQQLVRWKSAYYQDDLIAAAARLGREVPFLLVYGWTDEAVSSVDATSLAQKLKDADAGWPVYLTLADIGHTGQNKLTDWDPIHEQMRTFLDNYVRQVSASRLPTVTSRVATCDSSLGAAIQSGTLRDLGPDRKLLLATSMQRTSWTPGAQTVDSPFGCTAVPSDASAPGWTWQITDAFTLTGLPLVQLGFNASGSDADMHVRLWDIDPSRNQRVLITRGVYKYHGSGGISIAAFALMGAAWHLAAGHMLQLELAQTDTPLFAPDRLASSIEYKAVALTLPGRAG
jgi:dienelactone hydrolase